ncbi:replication-associated recombination protein A [Pseudoglutamicibacter cumminsii]|uniref:replication-associated recombination protein A n=1 Tax=Pseudoglutamicibacter cumminsii TaxID=156979 RepID=UPI0025525E88|nr:replication-associated recombination protein A [Pseudoglutamicibacter cumminsii]MDZ3745689.1 replication-associated recombination protein A [Pseudoglutamicibacter cumminsii]
MDLFSSAQDDDSESQVRDDDRPRPRPPLAVRMRPKTIDEVAGQQHLLGSGSPLRQLAESDGGGPAGLSSLILYGPPGVGKTTLAHVIANGPHRTFVELSAISAGVKDVRQVMEQARTDRSMRGTTTVLFLDEIHRFNKAQQDALLPGVENGWVVLVAATTENPSFSVISPLLSRSLLLKLKPLEREDVRGLLARALESPRGLGNSVEVPDDVMDQLIDLSGGDARRALTSLEAAAAVALERARHEAEESDDEATLPVVTREDAERAVDTALRRYDKQGDNHYDTASALIKSIRGSDVDAALHYAAVMIEAGEDPRFLARRLVISASEDIGMADPTALQTAVAAAQAVQLIGMPEARIVLAQAVVHLASAPKSNAAYVAIDKAIADVRAGKGNGVPAHLRDAHYAGAKALGHGKGYVYPHDHELGVVAQQYAPDDLQGVDYYKPTQHGFERTISQRLESLRSILRKN